MRNLGSQLMEFITEKAGEQAALFCYAPLKEILLLIRTIALVCFFVMLAPLILVANSFYCLHYGITLYEQGKVLWESPLWLTSASIAALTLISFIFIFRKGFWLKKIAPLAHAFQTQMQILNQKEREREWVKDVVTQILNEKATREQTAPN